MSRKKSERKSLETREGEIILYTTPDGVAKVEVFFQEETFWLSQRRMAELFDVEVHTINYHLKEIYASGELMEPATIRKIRIVQNEGERSVSREVDFYNSDVSVAKNYLNENEIKGSSVLSPCFLIMRKIRRRARFR